MELNWLECLVFGIVSGLAELLPASAPAHQTIFLKLIGGVDTPVLRLCAHLGALAAVILAAMPHLIRYRRELRFASIPHKRRHRRPDFAVMMELRVLRTAAVTMLIVMLVCQLFGNLHQRLWLLALMVFINGVILYLPQFLPRANKTAQSLSGLDALLIGLSAGFGAVPGISRAGAMLSAASIRGTDRSYAMELVIVISIPALVMLLVMDIFSVAGASLVFAAPLVLGCLLCSASSFGAAYAALFLMRFLSVKAGYGAFALYNWGAALFTLVIYLI